MKWRITPVSQSHNGRHSPTGVSVKAHTSLRTICSNPSIQHRLAIFAHEYLSKIFLHMHHSLTQLHDKSHSFTGAVLRAWRPIEAMFLRTLNHIQHMTCFVFLMFNWRSCNGIYFSLAPQETHNSANHPFLLLTPWLAHQVVMVRLICLTRKPPFNTFILTWEIQWYGMHSSLSYFYLHLINVLI